MLRRRALRALAPVGGVDRLGVEQAAEGRPRRDQVGRLSVRRVVEHVLGEAFSMPTRIELIFTIALTVSFCELRSAFAFKLIISLIVLAWRLSWVLASSVAFAYT